MRARKRGPSCPPGKLSRRTASVVYKATHRITGELVALKAIKIDNEKEGVRGGAGRRAPSPDGIRAGQFPLTALREIKSLQRIRHENVVRLLDVVSDPAQGWPFV